MSVWKLELELPFGFQPDPILETTTPENRAIVLTTGCVALKALLNKTNSLSYEEAYAKASAEEAQKWLAEKSELENKFLREKTEFQSQKDFQEKQLHDKLAAEQEKITRKEEELTTADTLRRIAEVEVNALRESQHQNILAERERTRENVESGNLARFLQLNKDLEKANADAIKAKADADKAAFDLRACEKEANAAAVQAVTDKTDAVEKVRKEFTEQLLSATGRQASSSLKGKDNENKFAQLLHQTFGLTPDYLNYERRIESGDHMIQWEGLKLMFENKIYKDTVPIKEVEKAIADFKKHPECDVLIFVSETSSIAKHERPGHLDIDTVDGRPAIWIGEFNNNVDKFIFLSMIAQVIRQLARLQKRAKELGNGDDVVDDYKNKIIAIRCYLQSTKEDLDSLVKEQKSYQRAQTSAWNKLKEQITTFQQNFIRRLERAMKDDDDLLVL